MSAGAECAGIWDDATCCRTLPFLPESATRREALPGTRD